MGMFMNVRGMAFAEDRSGQTCKVTVGIQFAGSISALMARGILGILPYGESDTDRPENVEVERDSTLVKMILTYKPGDCEKAEQVWNKMRATLRDQKSLDGVWKIDLENRQLENPFVDWILNIKNGEGKVSFAIKRSFDDKPAVIEQTLKVRTAYDAFYIDCANPVVVGSGERVTNYTPDKFKFEPAPDGKFKVYVYSAASKMYFGGKSYGH